MILRVNPSRVVRGLSLAAALLLLAPGSRAEDTVVSGTLPEDYLPGLKSLVHAAVKESPTMILQQIQLAQSEAGLLAGDASLYPQLSGSVGYNQDVWSGRFAQPDDADFPIRGHFRLESRGERSLTGSYQPDGTAIPFSWSGTRL